MLGVTLVLAYALAGSAQPERRTAQVGAHVVDYGSGVTEGQARDLAHLVAAFGLVTPGVPVVLDPSDDGFLLEATVAQGFLDQPAAEQTVQLLGAMVSAYVLDAAALSLRVSDFVTERTISIALVPDSALFHALRGDAFARLGRNADAIGSFQRAVALEPNPGLHVALGRLLLVEWRDGEADHAFRAALELDPEFAEAHYQLGELAYQQGRVEPSLAHFRRAIQLAPGHANAHYTLGAAYDFLRRYDEAIDQYKRSLAIRDRADVYNDLGASYGNKRMFEDALATFRAGIERFPENPLFYRNVASTLDRLGREDEAEAAWTRAIEVYRQTVEATPNDPDAHTSLGHLLAERNMIDAAITAFRRALEIDERAPLTWGGLGDAYLAVGRKREALESFRRLVGFMPQDGSAHYRLGKALQAAGRDDEAETELAEARRLGYPPR